MEHTFSLGVPFFEEKRNGRNGDHSRPKLYNYKWFSNDVRTDQKIRLSSPFFDKLRRIYIVWDAGENHVMYTDEDLNDWANKGGDENDKIIWRRLIENFPYYYKGKWYFYDSYPDVYGTTPHRTGPILREHWRVINLVRSDGSGVDSVVIVCDPFHPHRRFSAKIPVGWTGLTNSDAQVSAPLPSNLVWAAYVPSNPFSLLFDGKPDPRIRRVEDLNGVFFLLDKELKTILYWNDAHSEWREYVVANPGWGVYAGSDWLRKGVEEKELNKAKKLKTHFWRDPLTFTLYALVNGPDYHDVNRLFLHMRERLYRAVIQLEAVPDMMKYYDILNAQSEYDLLLSKVEADAEELKKLPASDQRKNGLELSLANERETLRQLSDRIKRFTSERNDMSKRARNLIVRKIGTFSKPIQKLKTDISNDLKKLFEVNTLLEKKRARSNEIVSKIVDVRNKLSVYSESIVSQEEIQTTSVELVDRLKNEMIAYSKAYRQLVDCKKNANVDNEWDRTESLNVSIDRYFEIKQNFDEIENRIELYLSHFKELLPSVIEWQSLVRDNIDLDFEINSLEGSSIVLGCSIERMNARLSSLEQKHAEAERLLRQHDDKQEALSFTVDFIISKSIIGLFENNFSSLRVAMLSFRKNAVHDLARKNRILNKFTQGFASEIKEPDNYKTVKSVQECHDHQSFMININLSIRKEIENMNAFLKSIMPSELSLEDELTNKNLEEKIEQVKSTFDERIGKLRKEFDDNGKVRKSEHEQQIAAIEAHRVNGWEDLVNKRNDAFYTSEDIKLNQHNALIKQLNDALDAAKNDIDKEIQKLHNSYINCCGIKEPYYRVGVLEWKPVLEIPVLHNHLSTSEEWILRVKDHMKLETLLLDDGDHVAYDDGDESHETHSFENALDEGGSGDDAHQNSSAVQSKFDISWSNPDHLKFDFLNNEIPESHLAGDVNSGVQNTAFLEVSGRAPRRRVALPADSSVGTPAGYRSNHTQNHDLFRIMPCLDPVAPLKISHRVSLVRSSNAARYYYTDYGTWITFTLDYNERFYNSPPWKKIVTNATRAISGFMKMNKDSGLFVDILDEMNRNGTFAKMLRYRYKVCTGRKHFMHECLEWQKLDRPGLILYPVSDIMCRDLGFVVVTAGAIMNNKSWDQLIEGRIKKYKYEKLVDFAKEKRIEFHKEFFPPGFSLGAVFLEGKSRQRMSRHDRRMAVMDENEKKLIRESRKASKGDSARKTSDSSNVKKRQTGARGQQRDDIAPPRVSVTHREDDNDGEAVARSENEAIRPTSPGAAQTHIHGVGGIEPSPLPARHEHYSEEVNGDSNSRRDTSEELSLMEKNEQLKKMERDRVYGEPVFDETDWYFFISQKEKHPEIFLGVVDPRPEDVYYVKDPPVSELTSGVVLIRFGTEWTLISCLRMFFEIRRVLEKIDFVIPEYPDTPLESLMDVYDKLELRHLEIQSHVETVRRLDHRTTSIEEELKLVKSNYDTYNGKLEKIEAELEAEQNKLTTCIQRRNDLLHGNLIGSMDDAEFRSIVIDIARLEQIVSLMLAQKEETIATVRMLDSIRVRLEKEKRSLATSIMRDNEKLDNERAELKEIRSRYIGEIRSPVSEFTFIHQKLEYSERDVPTDNMLSDDFLREYVKDAIMMAGKLDVSTVVFVQRDVQTLFQVGSVVHDKPVVEQVMYLCYDEQRNSFSLCVPKQRYLRYRMANYYSIPRNHEWIAKKKELVNSEAGVGKEHPVIKEIVLDSLGNIRKEFWGDVPIFALYVHEQPHSNYSFYTACRDAMAAYLDLPAWAIASASYFVRELFDYLHTLPDGVCNLLAGVSDITIHNANRSPPNIRKYVLDNVIAPLFAALASGKDICLTTDQLWVISTVGIPIYACATPEYLSQLPDRMERGKVIPAIFYLLRDVEGTIHLDKTIGKRYSYSYVDYHLSKRGAPVSIPLLLHLSENVEVQPNYASQFASEQLVRGNVVAYHYHLLCVPDVKYHDNGSDITENTEEGHEAQNENEAQYGINGDSTASIVPVHQNGTSFPAGGELNSMYYDPNLEHLGHPLYCGVKFEVSGSCKESNGSSLQPAPIFLGPRFHSDTDGLNDLQVGSGGGVPPNASTNGVNHRTQLVLENSGTNTYAVFGPARSVEPGENSTVGYTRNEGALVNAVNDTLTRVLVRNINTVVKASDRPNAYVIDTGLFPKYNYFEKMPLDFFENLDHVFLKPESGHDNIPDSSDYDTDAANLHSNEAIYRLELSALQTFCLSDLRSFSGKQQIYDAQGAVKESVNLGAIHDRLWNLVLKDGKVPELKPYSFLNTTDLFNLTCNGAIEFITAQFMLFMVQREFDGREIATLVGDDHRRAHDMITDYTELVEQWIKKATRVHSEKVHNHSPAQIETFKNSGFIPYILEAVVTQWERFMKEEHYVKDAIHSLKMYDWSLAGVQWEPRNHENRTLEFMQQSVHSPFNSVVLDYYLRLGFRPTNSKLTTLYDLLSANSFLDVTHEDVKPRRDYFARLIQRLSFVYSMCINDVDQPLDMDLLRLLSRTYCESKGGSRYLHRSYPTVNFIVVERVEPSPLGAQLRILLTSDPRGLSLAFSLRGLHHVLAKEADTYIGQDYTKNEDFLNDLYARSFVRIIQKVNYTNGECGFFLMNCINSCRMVESTASTDLLGDKFAIDDTFLPGDILAGVASSCHEIKKSIELLRGLPLLPERPFRFEFVNVRKEKTFSEKEMARIRSEAETMAKTLKCSWQDLEKMIKAKRLVETNLSKSIQECNSNIESMNGKLRTELDKEQLRTLRIDLIKWGEKCSRLTRDKENITREIHVLEWVRFLINKNPLNQKSAKNQKSAERASSSRDPETQMRIVRLRKSLETIRENIASVNENLENSGKNREKSTRKKLLKKLEEYNTQYKSELEALLKLDPLYSESKPDDTGAAVEEVTHRIQPVDKNDEVLKDADEYITIKNWNMQLFTDTEMLGRGNKLLLNLKSELTTSDDDKNKKRIQANINKLEKSLLKIKIEIYNRSPPVILKKSLIRNNDNEIARTRREIDEIVLTLSKVDSRKNERDRLKKQKRLLEEQVEFLNNPEVTASIENIGGYSAEIRKLRHSCSVSIAEGSEDQMKKTATEAKLESNEPLSGPDAARARERIKKLKMQTAEEYKKMYSILVIGSNGSAHKENADDEIAIVKDLSSTPIGDLKHQISKIEESIYKLSDEFVRSRIFTLEKKIEWKQKLDVASRMNAIENFHENVKVPLAKSIHELRKKILNRDSKQNEQLYNQMKSDLALSEGELEKCNKEYDRMVSEFCDLYRTSTGDNDPNNTTKTMYKYLQGLLTGNDDVIREEIDRLRKELEGISESERAHMIQKQETLEDKIRAWNTENDLIQKELDSVFHNENWLENNDYAVSHSDATRDIIHSSLLSDNRDEPFIRNVYSVTAPCRPRVPFVNFELFNDSNSYKIPECSRRHFLNISTDSELRAFAYTKKIRVFLFELVDEHIRIKHVYDHRTHIIESNSIFDTTSYFLKTEIHMLTLVPTVSGLVFDNFDQAREMQQALLEYCDELHKRIGVMLTAIKFCCDLARSVGIRFGFLEETIDVEANCVARISKGLAFAAWETRFFLLKKPDLIAFNLDAGSLYDLMKLYLFLDNLSTFHALVSRVFHCVKLDLFEMADPGVETLFDSFVSFTSRLSGRFVYDVMHNPELCYFHNSLNTLVRNFEIEYFENPNTPSLANHHVHPFDLKRAYMGHICKISAQSVISRARAIQDRVAKGLSTNEIFEWQRDVVRLFMDEFSGARFFVQIDAVHSKHARLFSSHVGRRIGNNVAYYYDQDGRAAYKWNSETKTNEKISMLLPFWEDDKMCIMERYEEYVSAWNKIAECKQIIKALKEILGGADEDDGGILEEILDENEETIQRQTAFMEDHRREHVFVWDDNLTAFTRNDADERRTVLKRAKEMYRETLSDIKRFSSSYEQTRSILQEMNVDTLNADYRRVLEELNRECDEIKTELDKSKTKLINLDSFIRQAESDITLNSGVQHFQMPSGYHFDHNRKNLNYVWTEGRVNVSFYISYTMDSVHGKSALLNTPLERIASGSLGSWIPIIEKPKYDAVTDSFNENDEVWFDPVSHEYHWLDFERRIWKKSAETPGKEWTKISAIESRPSLFLEVESTAVSMVDIAEQLERKIGVLREDLYFVGTRAGDTWFRFLTRNHFKRLPARNGANICVSERIFISTSNKKRFTAPDVLKDIIANRILPNHNRTTQGNLNRIKRWMNNDLSTRDMQTNGLDRDRGPHWSEILSINEVNSGWSKLPCKFEADRFLSMRSGLPNHLAVDFGCSGHNPAWENPIVIFRESWFLWSGDRILVIPRTPFHTGFFAQVENSQSIVTNPTGVLARNVERYWGHRPETRQLALKYKLMRRPGETFTVVDKRALFQQRVEIFYRWIHCPRNWFWDEERQDFFVFAFTPDMVSLAHPITGRQIYVQQLAEYRVGILFEEKFGESVQEFLSLRKRVEFLWGKVEFETKNQIPPNLRHDVEIEQAAQNGYSKEVKTRVESWWKQMMAGLKDRADYMDFVKYYMLSGGYAMFPNAAKAKDTYPKDEASALKMVADRQVETRRRFWRLFREKFGVHFYSFLTDAACREGILRKSPEPLGPYYFLSPDINEGIAFLNAWKKENEKSRPQEFSVFFHAYFSSNDADESDIMFDVFNGMRKSEKFAPHDPFYSNCPVTYQALERWYWDASDIDHPMNANAGAQSTDVRFKAKGQDDWFWGNDYEERELESIRNGTLEFWMDTRGLRPTWYTPTPRIVPYDWNY